MLTAVNAQGVKAENTINYDEKIIEQSPQVKTVPMGYCIRTGNRIPFNPNKPFSDEAYQNWAKFGNEEYPEKYCHFSGEKSYGDTTKAKPILRKNWSAAKKVFNF